MKKQEKLQLVFSDSWHLAWGSNRGLPLWIPQWIHHLIIHIWNPIVCLFTGHYLVGTVGDNHYCSHCYNCCKDTKPPCEFCKWLEDNPRKKKGSNDASKSS